MEFGKLLEELKQLNLPNNKFAIFGSGPMIVRGMRETNDIDIVVSKDLWDKFSNSYQINKKGNVVIGNIEVCHSCEPLGEKVEKLISTADIIDGLPFVRLDYILQFKKILNREKDQSDVLLIENYLNKNN